MHTNMSLQTKENISCSLLWQSAATARDLYSMHIFFSCSNSPCSSYKFYPDCLYICFSETSHPLLTCLSLTEDGTGTNDAQTLTWARSVCLIHRANVFGVETVTSAFDKREQTPQGGGWRGKYQIDTITRFFFTPTSALWFENTPPSNFQPLRDQSPCWRQATGATMLYILFTSHKSKHCSIICTVRLCLFSRSFCWISARSCENMTFISETYPLQGLREL